MKTESKEPGLMKRMREFLTSYLPVVKKKSPHTVTAYRDALNVYMAFLQSEKGIKFRDVTANGFCRQIGSPTYTYDLARLLVDKLIIGVLNNKAKCPLFSAQERVNMLKEVTASLPNVEIQSFEGLLIDFVRGSHADIVVRGLRAITDFEYELQMAQTNRVIAPEIDTIFLTTNLKYSYLSSSCCASKVHRIIPK